MTQGGLQFDPALVKKSGMTEHEILAECERQLGSMKAKGTLPRDGKFEIFLEPDSNGRDRVVLRAVNPKK